MHVDQVIVKGNRFMKMIGSKITCLQLLWSRQRNIHNIYIYIYIYNIICAGNVHMISCIIRIYFRFLDQSW
ncbi:hypothetical protein ACMBCM_08825, partial [Spiroplasma sp. K1]